MVFSVLPYSCLFKTCNALDEFVLFVLMYRYVPDAYFQGSCRSDQCMKNYMLYILTYYATRVFPCLVAIYYKYDYIKYWYLKRRCSN